MPAKEPALTFERCDPVLHEAEIKELFVKNERPSFPGVFDRRYRHGSAHGGSSWLAWDGTGRLVGHVAVFPRTFFDGGRCFRAGVFSDLMFDPEHRTFFPTVKLLGRAKRDLKEEGLLDFVYGVSMMPAAAALRAAGLKEIGGLRRFVLPLNWLYRSFHRFRSGVKPLGVHRQADAPADSLIERLTETGTTPNCRFRRDHQFYDNWFSAETTRKREWLLMRSAAGARGSIVGAVLTEPDPTSASVAIVDLLWDEQLTSVASVLHAAAAAVRGGCNRKLTIRVLSESKLAEALGRCGFVGRADQVPVLVAPIGGDSAVPASPRWVLTWVDGGTW